MKNLLYLVVITCSCCIYGQNITTNYEIGNYVDYDKKIINGYLDFDYEPKTSLNVSYSAAENFANGYYCDSNGLKVTGLLKYDQKDRELKFKLNEQSGEESINADESKGYVIGVDTFSVVKNVAVIGLLGEGISDKSEFAEKIETVSGMQFYKFMARATNGVPYVKYLVKNSETSDFATFPSGNGKFRKMAAGVFGNDRVLKADIEKGKYDEGDIPSLIKIYKYKKLYEKGQNIFYNSFRDEINNSDESAFYTKIETVKDSVFHMIHYFKNNTKIYEGDFTSFYRHYKQDNFLFYFPNGEIRKKIIFNNNKAKQGMEFFENGKGHRIYDILEYGTIKYRAVYNDNAVNVLDERGNGSELFLDVITGKKIAYEYKDQKLKSAYFTDSNGEKIYQVCENNAEIKKIKSLQKLIKEKLIYPLESAQKGNHGFVLIKCIVEPTGLVSEIKVIKGLDAPCDKAALEFLTCFKTEVYWNPGKVNGENIKQEIIFPIDFSIIENSSYRNHYYNYNTWFFHNMMMQQNMMMHQNMMRAPMGRF